jgi:hypothetical protein
MRLAPLLLSLALLPTPVWAAKTLDTPIQSEPCKIVVLPDGQQACEPKTSQVIIPGCTWVTVRQKGKRDRKLLACAPPREKRQVPQPSPRPLPVGGY